jgi:hypothetical protein
VRRHHHLRSLHREVAQQRDQSQAGDERQRRVGLVHQVEAALVDPGPQDLHEPLAVTELVQPFWPAPARVLLKERVQRVHRVRPQEVRPGRAPGRPPLDVQPVARARLARPDPGRPGRRQDGPALRVEPVRLGQQLDHGGLTRPVLADQDRDPRRQLKPLAQQLRGGGNGPRPRAAVDGGTAGGPERAHEPRVGRPVASLAHKLMVPDIGVITA